MNAVVHAHPPTATGFAVAGVPLVAAVPRRGGGLARRGRADGAVRRARGRRLPRAGAASSPRTTRCCSAGTACSRGARSRDRPICAWSWSSTWRASRWSRGSSAACGRCRRRRLPTLLEARAKAGLGLGRRVARRHGARGRLRAPAARQRRRSLREARARRRCRRRRARRHHPPRDRRRARRMNQISAPSIWTTRHPPGRAPIAELRQARTHAGGATPPPVARLDFWRDDEQVRRAGFDTVRSPARSRLATRARPAAAPPSLHAQRRRI